MSFTVDANAGAPRIGTISVAGKTFTITQGGVDCAFSLGSNSQYFSIGQASSSVTVNASSPGCAWTATSDASWVSITAGSTGNGNGSVGFTVFGNSGPARAATITVAGREFHITQGTGGIFVLSAQNIALPPGGGTGTFTFTANDPGCGWDAVTGDPSVTINGSSSGNGNGTIMVSAPLNNTTTRSGLVYVGAQTIIISQAFGCSTSLSTNTASFGPNGGTGSFNLIAPAGCPWTATSQAGWITITSLASGTGNTTIAYSVDPNPGDNRNGTISSGGVFTVHQTRNPALSKTLFDYDGDRKADISVFRPATSTWYFRYSQIGYNGKEFGAVSAILSLRLIMTATARPRSRSFGLPPGHGSGSIERRRILRRYNGESRETSRCRLTATPTARLTLYYFARQPTLGTRVSARTTPSPLSALAKPAINPFSVTLTATAKAI